MNQYVQTHRSSEWKTRPQKQTSRPRSRAAPYSMLSEKCPLPPRMVDFETGRGLCGLGVLGTAAWGAGIKVAENSGWSLLPRAGQLAQL